MESGRKLRAAGEILRLGGVDYRLESVEGRGGSAVVYRAVYEAEPGLFPPGSGERAVSL